MPTRQTPQGPVKYPYTGAGMSRYRQDVAEDMAIKESPLPGRLMDTAQGAAHGAMAGSQFGPWGALFGGVTGGTAAAVGIDPANVQALGSLVPGKKKKKEKKTEEVPEELSVDVPEPEAPIAGYWQGADAYPHQRSRR